MEWNVDSDNGNWQVMVTARGDVWVVEIDGETLEIQVSAAGQGNWLVKGKHGRERIGAVVSGNTVHVQDEGGWELNLEVTDANAAALNLSARDSVGEIITEMPGVVVRVPAQKGQMVSAGQPLAIVEAMKMENEFKSPIDGVVVSVNVQPGDAVESGAVLVVVEAEAS